jgi:hypothetical protein
VEAGQVDLIESQLKDAVLLGTLKYSRSLQEADLNRTAVFEADAEITQELEQSEIRLAELIAMSNSRDS